jgi:hypothetical protein
VAGEMKFFGADSGLDTGDLYLSFELSNKNIKSYRHHKNVQGENNNLNWYSFQKS